VLNWLELWSAHGLFGLVGIGTILGVCYGLSSQRHAISWRLVLTGLSLQVLLAVLILKLPQGQALVQLLGRMIEKLLGFSNEGAGFVFGFLVNRPQVLEQVFGAGSSFIFAFKLVPTIIFVAMLVSLAYYFGWLQRVVQGLAWGVYRLLGVSGAEALSNTASVFVGQIEAQLLIKPYLSTMTSSELMTVMAGSMACLSGAIMAVYIQMGIPAAYILTASVMAIPGALVISKLLYPETEVPATQGNVSLSVPKQAINWVDAAAHGATEGMRIGLNVCAMLIGFIALIALIDGVLAFLGRQLLALGVSLDFLGHRIDTAHLSLKSLLGAILSGAAVLLGTPAKEADTIGALMGTKLVLNEFVAYVDFAPLIQQNLLSAKAIAIGSVALCGFANFASVAMLLGALGEMAPNRQGDLARLGMKALLAGTLASYLSSAWAGILVAMDDPQPVLYAGLSVNSWLLLTLALLGLYLGQRFPCKLFSGQLKES
jgi:concentrative nucleoside transporter, CNT family